MSSRFVRALAARRPAQRRSSGQVLALLALSVPHTREIDAAASLGPGGEQGDLGPVRGAELLHELALLDLPDLRKSSTSSCRAVSETGAPVAPRVAAWRRLDAGSAWPFPGRLGCVSRSAGACP